MKKLILTSVVALSVFVGAQSVSAFTASEVETLITLLGGSLSSTQIASLRALATPATPAVSYTRQMGVGATGADVSALQSMLISKSYLMIAAPTGYFGTATQGAVAKYQAANGITPASGYVGPMTLAKLNASVVVPPVVPPVTPIGGDLSGTDGTISDVTKLSQYDNEEVGDGQSDVKVMGFEVKSSKDGDIALKSVKLTFNGTANTGSKKLADYLDSVSVWQGSKKIGTVDASDFNKDSTGVYSKTVSLSGATVKSDTKEKFYVTVDSVSNLDSGDITGSADDWNVTLNNIRYEDGSGVVTTDTDSGDLGGALNNVDISFVTFATAADTKFKISKDSSSPVSGVVTVSDTEDTQDVLLLVGKIKLEGTSDAVLNELPITLTSTVDNLNKVTNSVKLVIDGEEYTQTVSAAALSATTTFDNLDLNVSAGDTITFKVYADINTVAASDLTEGATLVASLTSTNRDYVDVENEKGDQLSSSEKTGSATGEAQSFYLNGITLSNFSYAYETVSAHDPGTSGSKDQVTYKLTYKITAGDEDVFIDKSIVSSSSPVVAGAGTAWATTTDSDAGVTTSAQTVSMSVTGATTEDTANVYKINSGESRTFTLSVTLTASSTGSTAVRLTGVNWTTESSDTTPNNYYTFNLSDYKTGLKVMTVTP